MNICNIRKTFELASVRNWDTFYVMVDLHGVIIPGNRKRKNVLSFISSDCIEVLQWFTIRKDFRLILWTSSFDDEVVEVLEWLGEYHIHFDYVNGNPECQNTEYADFYHKPYFNILIDDKAGFEPETDWTVIKKELIALGEWNK